MFVNDVFSDDVYETVPNIKQAMISEIENMNSDIKYLGWCMWSDKKLAPLCMHAYAMDANGARYVLSISHRYISPSLRPGMGFNCSEIQLLSTYVD